jgi:hypothetical protein
MGIDLIDLDSIGDPEYDWFGEMSTVIVDTQVDALVGGYWTGGPWGDDMLNTVWALLTLQRIAPPPPYFETVLCAAQDIPVGTVTVQQGDETMSITYAIDGEYDQWMITETHLQVFTSDDPFDGIPLSKSKKNNNPIPGQFDHSMMHDPAVDEYTYEIPLEGLTGIIYIAAHAVVINTDVVILEDPLTYLDETAWGGACDSENYWDDPDNLEGFVYFFNPGKGGNWASYFMFEIEE